MSGLGSERTPNCRGLCTWESQALGWFCFGGFRGLGFRVELWAEGLSFCGLLGGS